MGDSEDIQQDNPLLEEVKKELINFLNREYEEDNKVEDFDNLFPDLNEIRIAYTTTPDEKHEIQISLDLENYKMNTYVDNTLIDSFQYTYDPLDASDLEELIQMKTDIGFWDFSELVAVDEKKLKEILGLEIDDEGNFYDPLNLDLDNDGIPDRYDNDFKDSDYFESTYDVEDNFHAKEEKQSILEKIAEFKEQERIGEIKDKNDKIQER